MKFILWLLELIRGSNPPAPPPLVKIADPNEVFILEVENWIGTTEVGGDNSGPDVEAFQKAVDGSAQKESWCAGFVNFCIKQVEQKLNIKSKIYRSENCMETWQKTPVAMRLLRPERGCIVVWQHGTSNLGHMGVVENVADEKTIITIEGNTSPGEKSEVVRNGDGVYRRIRSQFGTFEMRIVGYIKPF